MVRMYHRCDMGFAGRVWPDGRGLLDQPCKLVAAFAVIGTALAKGKALA